MTNSIQRRALSGARGVSHKRVQKKHISGSKRMITTGPAERTASRRRKGGETRAFDLEADKYRNRPSHATASTHPGCAVLRLETSPQG